MLEKTWKTMDGVEVKDVVPVLKELMQGGDREIHVGSDSQQNHRFTELVTVIVVLHKGKGGRAFYIKDKLPRIKSLRERLLREVWMSTSVGLELNAMMPETAGLTIHVDANPNMKFRSSDHVKELTAMVVSQQFKCILKPYSWAASHCADHIVKSSIVD